MKGLDFALLEQTRAREAALNSTEDDELLENVLLAGPSTSTASTTVSNDSKRKRTREDLVRELKERRSKADDSADKPATKAEKGVEEARKEGKFKPIGFKPIGGSSSAAKKDGTRKKKKQKVEVGSKEAALAERPERRDENNVAEQSKSTATSQTVKRVNAPVEPDGDDDVDIFAGVGDYEGIGSDDESDNETGVGPSSTRRDTDVDNSFHKRIFDEEDQDDETPPLRSPPNDAKAEVPGQSGNPDAGGGDILLEPESPVRLAPLASSAVPSIRDILAADSALEIAEKRKARKEKKKANVGEDGKKKVSAETKLNREYKKLKAYTDQKGQSQTL